MKIYADTHTHTVASTHAFSTVTENCTAAAAAGMKGVALTDHFGAMPDAPHEWHFYSMRNLPRKICGVYLLRGAEVNITDGKGNIDLIEPMMISVMEWVVASIHDPVFYPKSLEECTRAYIGAARNPVIDCIGHPDGEDFPFDHEQVIRELKEHNKLLEINNSRLSRGRDTAKRYTEMLRVCKKHEVKVILNSDSHFHEQVGRLDNAVELVEAVGFPEELVLNADWDRFAEYVSAKHPHIFG